MVNPGGGVEKKVDCFMDSIGLSDPSDILIRFSLYQRI